MAKANKPPLTPTLDMSSDTTLVVEQSSTPAAVEVADQTADAVAKLASGSTPEEITATNTPTLVEQSAIVVEQLAPVADQTALVTHLTAQNVEFSKVNQELSVKLALAERDLAAATLKAQEHSELLSGLTTAACAAINLRQIQMGKSPSDLSHLTPQTALAEFNKTHNDFIKTFKPGQRSNATAEVGQDGGLGVEMAPTREQVQSAQRLGKK